MDSEQWAESQGRKGVGPLAQRTKRQVQERLEDAVHYAAHAYDALSDVRIGVSTLGVASCPQLQRPLDDLMTEAQTLVAGLSAALKTLKKHGTDGPA